MSRGHIMELQRARLLAAAGQVACEHGAANLTVGQIVERAGVSRRTFYEVFADGEDCVAGALHLALRRAGERVLPAWTAQGSWRERMRGALIALLGLFDEDPVVARMLIVESLGMGPRVLEQRTRVVEALAEAIDQGRMEARSAAQAPRLSAEGALGGVLGVLHARIVQPQPGGLLELAGPLMSMIVLPYQGRAVAHRELQRPLPSAREPREGVEPSLGGDPFKGAGMRLTYRTMRVLEAVGQQPGCSNRRIGDLAGMGDQGQVSKLLARLERLGLIANGDRGQRRGEPNSWTLTDAGRQVTESLQAHTERLESTPRPAGERGAA